MNPNWTQTKNTTYNRMAYLILLAVIVLLFSGCASTPNITSPRIVSPTTSHSKTPLVDYALSLQGAPYRYGKSSPEEGFDCSGFVQHIYKRYGKSLPRKTSDMALALPSVSKAELMAGDLVFFNTNGRAYSHVGIYIRNNQFIHAASQRTGKVLISKLNSPYWQQHFTGARRP